MYLYYSLRNLASVFAWLRGEFYDLGVSIRLVWLIGQYLSEWFFSIAGVCSSLEGATLGVAGDWLDFYRDIIDSLGIDDRLQDIIRYADDLITFIRNPFDWLADLMRYYFPDLFKIANDPVEWVLETIYRYTGFSFEFLDNPFRVVREWILDTVGDVIEIAKDPRGWVIDRLSDIIPDFWEFIHDARLWVRRKIEDEFPDLINFLRDPDDFLEDRLILFLDKLADKYRARAIKLFEKILNAIF